MNQNTPKPTHRTFLLSAWSDKAGRWRIMLQDAHSGERSGFVSVEEAVAALSQQLSADRGQKGEVAAQKGVPDGHD